MREEENKRSAVLDALYKKAVGFTAEEVTEEYQETEGDVKLVKKKITKKVVPPDITALKMIMENDTDNVKSMTDEELENEKQRLLQILKEGEKNAEK